MHAYSTPPDLAQRELFVLSVCTRKRPEMLRQCLGSILALKIPDNWQLQVVIIENDSSPFSQKIVEEYEKLSSFAITYRHEPDPGIPQARNHAIKYALEQDAEYLGFIDDDERITPDWLYAVHSTLGTDKCDVVQGVVHQEYDEDNIKPHFKRNKSHGSSLKTASTDNVAMRRKIYAPSPEGLNLRFNENRRFTGGEDSEFFFQATDAGAKIICSEKAVVHERIPVSRSSIIWKMSRAYQAEANASQIYVQRKGHIRAFAKYLPKILFRLTKSIVIFLLLIICFLYNRKTSRKLFSYSAQHYMAAIGTVAGLRGVQPEPYRSIDKN